MEKTSAAMCEDEKSYSIPEELYEQLPAEIRAVFDDMRKNSAEILGSVEKEIDNLVRLLKAIPTSSSLSYIYHRLRTSQFENINEGYMEQETLTTAFAVTYARLFVSSNGICVLKRSHIPAHLREIHDDLMKIRHERYAHNGGHKSIDTEVGFTLSGRQVYIDVQMSLGLHIGGRNEWEELVKCIDATIHERLNKLLQRLSEKTGYEWIFPTAPAPDWVGKYG